MRIDCHAHGADADRDPMTNRLVPPIRSMWRSGELAPEAYVKGSLDRGVDRIVIVDPPEVTFSLMDIFGEYVIPAPQVNLETATPDEIDALFQRGAVGIKFISPPRSYGDDSFFPLYDVIRTHRGLAVFHTGYIATDVYEPGGLHHRTKIVDITDMRPTALDRVARAFPELKILMSHFGNPWWEEAWKMIISHRNIHADFSGGTAYDRSMDMWAMIFAPNGKLDSAALEKICFGMDGTYFKPGVYGFQAVADFHDALYERLKVPKSIRAKIDRENLLSLIAP